MLDGQELYVNTVHNRALEAVRALANADDPRASSLLNITDQPISFWVEDERSLTKLKDIVIDAAAKRQTPVITTYLIPGRDSGGYSAGGASGGSDYLALIDRMISMLAPLPCIIILEPDALAHAASFGRHARQERLDLLAEATARLKRSQPLHAVYIDAGHAKWLRAETAATLLRQAGISRADGFSLNVSNFVPTPKTIAYGERVSTILGGAHFVIDTSRNGALTPPTSTFNPAGRKLGTAPTVQTGHPLIDAYLWIKVPGESDGGPDAPPAGTFWPEYAYGLIES